MLLLVFVVYLQLSKQETLLREILGTRQKVGGLQILHPSWGKAADPGAQFLVWGGGRTTGLYQTVFFTLLHEESNYLTRHVSTFPPSWCMSWGVGWKGYSGARCKLLWHTTKRLIKICFVIFTMVLTHHNEKVGRGWTKTCKEKRNETRALSGCSIGCWRP